MSQGKIIRALRTSSVLLPLTEPELQILANCGCIYEFSPGQQILQADKDDQAVFILVQGRLHLDVTMLPHGGRCEGEAIIEINSPGQVFGWSTWLKPGGIIVTAYALEPCIMVGLNLSRLKNASLFWKIGWRMLQSFYSLLQEYGLCPPNLQAMFKFEQMAAIEWMPDSAEV